MALKKIHRKPARPKLHEVQAAGKPADARAGKPARAVSPRARVNTLAGPHRILIVNEDARQIELYSDLIREVADCQIDVMEKLENPLGWSASSGYHLIVVDAAGEEALPLLETIRRLSPDTSVIVLSENATVEAAVAAIRLGAEDYLKKPFNLEAFRLAVKRALDRKAVFGEGTNASSYLLLLNACQMISASLEQNKIFGIVQSYFSRELRSPHSAIYRLQDGNPVRVEDTPMEGRTDRAMEEVLDIALHASNPLKRMAESTESHRFVERGQLTPGLFVFRFKCVGDADYFCVCLSPDKPQQMESFESRIRMLRAQTELTGRNIEQYLGVQHLVYVDDATGLYNTRYLSNILDREIAQAKATDKSFAILFLDGDRFKSINDNYGHLAGTKLLNELGAQLKKYVRGRDTVFRYGGDEFVAVLSPSDLVTAQAVAERIRASVEKHVFLEDEGLNIRITVSIGVALFPDHANSKKAVIDAADHAMYTAKRKTRNSVFIAPLAGEASEDGEVGSDA